MLLYNLVRNRQSETGPTVLGGKERVEDFISDIGGDAAPLILHSDQHFSVLEGSRHHHLTAFGHGLNCIDNEIEE